MLVLSLVLLVVSMVIHYWINQNRTESWLDIFGRRILFGFGVFSGRSGLGKNIFKKNKPSRLY